MPSLHSSGLINSSGPSPPLHGGDPGTPPQVLISRIWVLGFFFFFLLFKFSGGVEKHCPSEPLHSCTSGCPKSWAKDLSSTCRPLRAKLVRWSPDRRQPARELRPRPASATVGLPGGRGAALLLSAFMGGPGGWTARRRQAGGKLG